MIYQIGRLLEESELQRVLKEVRRELRPLVWPLSHPMLMLQGSRQSLQSRSL